MARNQFDPNGQAVIAREFVFAGKVMKKGDVFAYRKLGRTAEGKPCKLPENELRGLWLADMIDFVDKVKQHEAD